MNTLLIIMQGQGVLTHAIANPTITQSSSAQQNFSEPNPNPTTTPTATMPNTYTIYKIRTTLTSTYMQYTCKYSQQLIQDSSVIMTTSFVGISVSFSSFSLLVIFVLFVFLSLCLLIGFLFFIFNFWDNFYWVDWVFGEGDRVGLLGSGYKLWRGQLYKILLQQQPPEYNNIIISDSDSIKQIPSITHPNIQIKNMGNTGQKLCSAISLKKDKTYKVFLGGLDASGKTTILYKLKLDQIVSSIPTIGFNVQSFEFNQTKMEMWDVGGGCMIRQLFRHYFQGLSAIIYVIGDYEERFSQHKHDLWNFHLKYIDVKIPLLIFANKSDLYKDIDLQKIKAEIQEAAPGRNVHYQKCCAVTGDGLKEGLTWLTQTINPKK